MRIRLLLEAQKPIILRWDYRTHVTRTIYSILKWGNENYGSWLYNHGFRWRNRVYRLFVYSDLMPINWNPVPQGLGDVRWMIWHISSPDCRFVDNFKAGLEYLSGKFKVFDSVVEVVDMVCMETPESVVGLHFRTISPIAVSAFRPRYPIYLCPDGLEFVETLKRNLIRKWEAFHQQEWKDGEFDLRVWNPRQKLVRVFGTKVRAWYLNLQMWGDEKIIRFAYEAGLGIKNSQGFGMIEPGV